MDAKKISLRILWILASLLSVNGQESCAMYYLAQPPTDLPCNPYLDAMRFSLRIECMVVVNRNIGQLSDFQIRWFAQLGDDSTSQALNDTSAFFVRIDQPNVTTADFYIFHSQARIADMKRSILDRFWCQIDASENIKNSLNITTFQRSSQTIIADNNAYTSPLLPFCPQLFFFHQPSVGCADALTEGNDSQLQPPSDMDSSSIPTLLPTPTVPPNCPPNSFSEESVQTNRLVSVLLPSLLLPVLVAILLVIAAVIMTCRRSRKPDKKQQRRKGARVEYLASPVHITAPITATQSAKTGKSLTEEEEKVPPPRPPPPILQPPVKTVISPTSPTPPAPIVIPPSSYTAADKRFSQDIYDDITDTALEYYSMSTNDIYSMNTNAGDGYPSHTAGPARMNGLSHQTKAGNNKKGNAHYQNAALIVISDRAGPKLVPKPTAASLPSLLDPGLYHGSSSPRKQLNKAPRNAKTSDDYDTLAQKKKPNPTSSNNPNQSYYNHTPVNASPARLVEDNEPDYDEVDDDLETTPKPYGRENAKFDEFGRPNNCVSVVSECYEDMSGMDDFIDSYKSSIY